MKAAVKKTCSFLICASKGLSNEFPLIQTTAANMCHPLQMARLSSRTVLEWKARSLWLPHRLFIAESVQPHS